MQVAKDMFKQSLFERVSSWLVDRPQHLEISIWTNEAVTRLNTLQTTQFEHLIKVAGPRGIKVELLLHKLELWSPNFRLLEIVDRRRSSFAEHHWVFKRGSRVILVFKPRTAANSLRRRRGPPRGSVAGWPGFRPRRTAWCSRCWTTPSPPRPPAALGPGRSATRCAGPVACPPRRRWGPASSATARRSPRCRQAARAGRRCRDRHWRTGWSKTATPQ